MLLCGIQGEAGPFEPPLGAEKPRSAGFLLIINWGAWLTTVSRYPCPSSKHLIFTASRTRCYRPPFLKYLTEWGLSIRRGPIVMLVVRSTQSVFRVSSTAHLLDRPPRVAKLSRRLLYTHRDPIIHFLRPRAPFACLLLHRT